MIGWLYRLIVGRFTDCRHEWVIFREFRGEYVWGGGHCTRRTLRCLKCGDLKNHDGA